MLDSQTLSPPYVMARITNQIHNTEDANSNSLTVAPQVMALIKTDRPKIDAQTVLELQATLLTQDLFCEAASALASDIAVKLHYDRVSIGLIAPDQACVSGFSHGAEAPVGREENRAIVTAMNEAIEQCATVSYPDDPNEFPRINMAHAALARLSGNQVATIPLCHDGQIFGAMTLERGVSMSISLNEITSCEHVACLLGPILLLKWEAKQPWHARLRKEIADWTQPHLKSRQSGVNFVLFASLALVISLSLIPVQYNINAPARLEARAYPELINPLNEHIQSIPASPPEWLRTSRSRTAFDGIVFKQSPETLVQKNAALLTSITTRAYSLMIDVDEGDVSEVQPRQVGKLALISLPDKIILFQVQRITPSALTHDGHHFFQIEAVLAPNSAQHLLHTGLAGIAKIRIGQRPLLWIWSHHIIARVEYKIWCWGL